MRFWCVKIVSPKIWPCKFFDKFHVWKYGEELYFGSCSITRSNCFEVRLKHLSFIWKEKVVTSEKQENKENDWEQKICFSATVQHSCNRMITDSLLVNQFQKPQPWNPSTKAVPPKLRFSLVGDTWIADNSSCYWWKRFAELMTILSTTFKQVCSAIDCSWSWVK